MIPVILSGGSGSRLWPVSRLSFPKQFCELLDESLYTKTVKRLKSLGSPWTVTVRDLQVLTEKSLKEQGLPKDQVIYEPTGKNTAPAIAVLCKVFEQKGWQDQVVGIFPADHLIEDEAAFHKAVRLGESLAAQGHVVTLGVAPTYPATGYGYIETAEPMGLSMQGAFVATGFREKPNEETARDFITKGNFYWNAGMFIFSVKKMIELFKAHAADVWEQVSELQQDDLQNLPLVYSRVRAISIDYAIMERLKTHVCIPCNLGWSDLGSWDAIAEVMKFEKGVSKAKVEIGVSAPNRANFVYPIENKTYAFVGIDDLVVVDTSDALLIARKGETERVKEVVDQLKDRANVSATQHDFEVRPWGKFQILRDTEEFKSKTITVDPGAQISYQSHSKRAEHWIIVNGQGEVVLDGTVLPVRHGTHVHIPVGSKHRIRNTGDTPLRFVEIQLGTYFGEDDIVRYEDNYGRS